MTENFKLITKEDVREEMEKLGYYPTDLLVNITTKTLNQCIKGDEALGQDILAYCLSGPTGSGKTEYVKTFYQLYKKFVDNNTTFLTYQCNNTTGKSDLLEEVNISGIVKQEPENIIISGKLSEAIENANQGKSVVLFIDEFDKAPENVGAFFLSFLQSGEVYATQLGNLKLKDECKNNLKVFICKNNEHARLPEYVERRFKFVHMEQMSPKLFYQVATNSFGVDTTNFVKITTLIYNEMYKNQGKISRLPSCAEMLIAIKDANDMVEMKFDYADICQDLLNNLLKDENDKKNLANIIAGSENKELASLSQAFVYKSQKQLDKDTIENFMANHNIIEAEKCYANAKKCYENVLKLRREVEIAKKLEPTSMEMGQ